MTLIPVPRRPTIPRLRDIILLVYCPSCRKGCKKWWPGISGVIYWVYPPYLYEPSYKPGQSEDTAIHNVITHIQEENREVTLEHSQTLRELMIALHVS